MQPVRALLRLTVISANTFWRATEDTMIIAAFVMLSSIALYVGMQVEDLMD